VPQTKVEVDPAQIIEAQTSQTVIHKFGHHDDVMILVNSGSSLEHFPEKSYLLSLSRNHIFKGGSQATYIFACENV
jgi:hypothetical protein